MYSLLLNNKREVIKIFYSWDERGKWWAKETQGEARKTGRNKNGGLRVIWKFPRQSLKITMKDSEKPEEYVFFFLLKTIKVILRLTET